jgi:hypothetical protein
LESIGVVVELGEDTFLDEILVAFEGTFPTTKEFSKFARCTLPQLNPLDEPDAVLVAWMEREEVLFRTLERHLISERLSTGFDGDVDEFISFSLSVQNRRKSRAGLALENHVAVIFDKFSIQYTRTPITENKSKPDFIFPGSAQYHDPNFPASKLTMLATKSSLKERWRQILAEADKIPEKHLLTLVSPISEAQTDEMVSKNLQLVIPEVLHRIFTERQRSRLISLYDFIKIVESRQDMLQANNGGLLFDLT